MLVFYSGSLVRLLEDFQYFKQILIRLLKQTYENFVDLKVYRLLPHPLRSLGIMLNLWNQGCVDSKMFFLNTFKENHNIKLKFSGLLSDSHSLN